MGKKSTESNKLFQAGPGRNVIPNRHLPDDVMFGLYGRRFHRSGKILFEHMQSNPGLNDIDACPILYLYRHSLELYLKSIIRFGRRYSTYSDVEVQTSEKTLMQSHKLTDFLPGVRQTFEAAGWIWATEIEGLRTFADFERQVREFEQVDPGSYTFRYPVNKKGEASVPETFYMSMEIFCEHADSLLDALEAAVCGLDVELEQRYELQAEMERYYSDFM